MSWVLAGDGRKEDQLGEATVVYMAPSAALGSILLGTVPLPGVESHSAAMGICQSSVGCNPDRLDRTDFPKLECVGGWSIHGF